MSYYQIYSKYKNLPLERLFDDIQPSDIPQAINSNAQSEKQLLALLSPAAQDYLEDMAQTAHRLTVSNFGKTIQLYTPMYLSSYCDNTCAYCGFNAANPLSRKKLSLEEVEKEAACIASSGLAHILILTGDSRKDSPIRYIKDCLKILKKHFVSISIEIYALTQDEYQELSNEGVDGLTIYQETYDQALYDRLHISGPKKDYLFRLDAPERASGARMRNVNIGVLLGLGNWKQDAFFLGLHAKYLQDKFPDLEIGAAIPRLRPYGGNFKADSPVSDKNVVQIITALRIFLPRLGITLSTRESSSLRENLLPLGITRISAGSSTRVGGHTIESPEESNPGQFEISDTRSVQEIKNMLTEKGYQPVLKDWVRI